MLNASNQATSNSFLHIILGYSRGLFLSPFYVFRAVFVIVFMTAERIIEEVHATEQMFLLMTSLFTFMCQFFFFTLCDLCFFDPDPNPKKGKVVSGLTTLLLYSIATYFVARIRDTFLSGERSHGMGLNSRLLLRVAKVLLEFAKAVIVVLCLREQGLHYNFDVCYSSATFVYYLCSERIFVDLAIRSVKLFRYESFDTLEHLYVPITMHGINIVLTVMVMALLYYKGKFVTYVLLSTYFTLYLPIKDLIWNYITPLLLEQKTFSTFKVADVKDISRWDDICAVCLEKMSRARITPCNHMFHPECLKRCLQSSMQCPLCKNDFLRLA